MPAVSTQWAITFRCSGHHPAAAGLIQLITPLIRFSRVVGIPEFAVSLPSDLQLPATPLRLANGSPLSSGAHKGLSPSRFMAYIPVNQGTHAGHTQVFQPDFATHSWQLISSKMRYTFLFFQFSSCKWQNRLNAEPLSGSIKLIFPRWNVSTL